MKSIYKCPRCGRYVEKEYHCGVKAKLILDGYRRERLSKLLSGILRHFPWEVGLIPNTEGWIDIDDLVNAIKTKWRNKEFYKWLKKEHVIALALLDPKGRFEINGNRIRARYGHSIPVEIAYTEDTNVKILYHGTSSKNVNSILSSGIKSMRRLWVHLTTSKDDACINARRHGGKPLLLIIDADCLRSKGIKVYRASKIIYLTKYIPVECIKGIEECR